MSVGGALWAPEVSLINYLGDSLVCAPRAANTSCPHEAPFGRLCVIFICTQAVYCMI